MVLRLGTDLVLLMLTSEAEGDRSWTGDSESSKIGLGEILPGLNIQLRSISALGSGMETFFSSIVSSNTHSAPPAIQINEKNFVL